MTDKELMEVVADVLLTSSGFTFSEWKERFEERMADETFYEFYVISGAVKYWEKNIFNDFLTALKELEAEDE